MDAIKISEWNAEETCRYYKKGPYPCHFCPMLEDWDNTCKKEEYLNKIRKAIWKD